MKGIVSVLAVLTLAGVASAQQPQVYTPPAADPSVPTFMNAEVVRVDPSGRTITFRSESRETVLAVEGEALSGLSRLHPGDQVMLGYRLDTRDGRSTRIVTNVRAVTASAALPVSAARSTTIESVRVVALNPSRRTLTVDDGTGARHVLSVTGDAARGLRRFHAGDEVVLSYRPGKGRTRTVTRIEAVGVSAGGPATQVGTVVPAVTTSTTTATTTTAVAPAAVVVEPAAAGGIPVVNTASGPAVLRTVPSVPAPAPTVNIALPPATAGTTPENGSAADVEAVRAQGVRDFQAASSVLALKANEIDGLWFPFKDQCLGGTTPAGATSATGREWFLLMAPGSIKQPTDDACRQRLADLTRAADLFEQQLDIARDAARKADVLPGTMRDVLQRNRLDR
ncbi:MAG: hypothetical protein DMF80_03985 [Acidobacteria bacterium]|nr:MAG: hypothetical protein DMF80_03985 [Acidobacteriota bacterium]PYQ19433.1 MAG: hypothetical protein DMF81_21905 [Acidobacteriota bacterium]